MTKHVVVIVFRFCVRFVVSLKKKSKQRSDDSHHEREKKKEKKVMSLVESEQKEQSSPFSAKRLIRTIILNAQNLSASKTHTETSY